MIGTAGEPAAPARAACSAKPTRASASRSITNNGHVFYGHTGGDFGIASLLYWYPQTGYTTIILSNRDARAARVHHQRSAGR